MGYEFRRTIIGLVVLAILVLALGMLLFRTVFTSYYFTLFPFLVVVILIINIVFFYIFFRTMNKSDVQFIRSFMASTVMKTMFFLVIILIFVLAKPQYAIPFSVTLLMLYFIFTAYDLYIMLKLLKRKKEKKPTTDSLSN